MNHNRKASLRSPGNLMVTWKEHNLPHATRDLLLLSAVVTTFLIPADAFLFRGFFLQIISSYRMVAAVAFSLGYLIIRRRSAGALAIPPYIASATLVATGLTWHMPYIGLLAIAPDHDTYVLVLANIILQFSSMMVLYRFSWEQLIVAAGTYASLLLTAVARPSLIRDIALLAIAQTATIAISTSLRHALFASLQHRLRYLRSFVPDHFARLLVSASDTDFAQERIFPRSTRFVICLSADWREYQQLAMAHPPLAISSLFEQFYDVIFEHLESRFPNGNYFADWVADEFFAVFFDDNTSPEELSNSVIDFGLDLATTVNAELRSKCSIPVTYDIGIASGFALIGLQGPATRRKTTVVGEVPGRARRLETEAKRLRYADPQFDRTGGPILLIDKTLHTIAQRTAHSHAGAFTPITSRTKNITGGTCFSWQDQETNTSTGPSRKVG